MPSAGGSVQAELRNLTCEVSLQAEGIVLDACC